MCVWEGGSCSLTHACAHRRAHGARIRNILPSSQLSLGNPKRTQMPSALGSIRAVRSVRSMLGAWSTWRGISPRRSNGRDQRMAMDGGAVAVVSEKPTARPENMAKVYAEFWRMQEIAQSVEASINYVVENSPASFAEASDDDPRWFLIETFPASEARAIRSLARRHFGVIQPMTQRRDRYSGNLVQGWQPVFSGWLFVRTWNIRKMRRRILSADGVLEILHDAVSGEAWPIPDWFVDMLDAEGQYYYDHAPPMYRRSHWSVTATRQAGRSRQKKRRPRPSNKIRNCRPQPS